MTSRKFSSSWDSKKFNFIAFIRKILVEATVYVSSSLKKRDWCLLCISLKVKEKIIFKFQTMDHLIVWSRQKYIQLTVNNILRLVSRSQGLNRNRLTCTSHYSCSSRPENDWCKKRDKMTRKRYASFYYRNRRAPK